MPSLGMPKKWTVLGSPELESPSDHGPPARGLQARHPGCQQGAQQSQAQAAQQPFLETFSAMQHDELRRSSHCLQFGPLPKHFRQPTPHHQSEVIATQEVQFIDEVRYRLPVRAG